MTSTIKVNTIQDSCGSALVAKCGSTITLGASGKTIAHGYYMVSLLPKLAAQNAEIKNTSRTLNYGSDKVRFINMVKVGSHVRLNRTIISCEEMKNGGFRVVNKCELEIKDDTKPAFIAETISLVFP